MKKFHVVRTVNRTDGSCAAPAESFETKEAAESTFYTRCSQACAAVASGENISDCVILYDYTGFILDNKGWINEPAE